MFRLYTLSLLVPLTYKELMQSITEERTEENNFIYTRPYASLDSFKTTGGKFRDEFIYENRFKSK